MEANTIPTQKARPVIFSGLMVRAILDGSKTQTRRIVKLKFPFSAGIAEVAGYHMGTTETPPVDMRVKLSCGTYHHMDFLTFAEKYCPYGVAGDRLWVRETFAVVQSEFDRGWSTIYRASHEWPGPWKPAIYMPRAKSRITLEITKVRVERLQEISNEDCVAEGIKMLSIGLSVDAAHLRVQYRHLWDSINGKGAWELNPWVWVIDFCPETSEKV